jgi:hypothetical protein
MDDDKHVKLLDAIKLAFVTSMPRDFAMNPRMEKIANPAKTEVKQFEKERRIASLHIR